MLNDHLSDILTRIRNAYLAHRPDLVVPHTKLVAEVVKVMVESKYLASATADLKVTPPTLHLVLNYVAGAPALTHLKRISKPGVRLYTQAKTIHPTLSGMGLTILSTSHGVMSAKNAKRAHLGGEVLCELW